MNLKHTAQTKLDCYQCHAVLNGGSLFKNEKNTTKPYLCKVVSLFVGCVYMLYMCLNKTQHFKVVTPNRFSFQPTKKNYRYTVFSKQSKSQ